MNLVHVYCLLALAACPALFTLLNMRTKRQERTARRLSPRAMPLPTRAISWPVSSAHRMARQGSN